MPRSEEEPLVVSLERLVRKIERKAVRVAVRETRELLPSMTERERDEWVRQARDRVARAKMGATPSLFRKHTNDAGGRIEESAMLSPKRYARRDRLNGHARGCACPVCQPGGPFMREL